MAVEGGVVGGLGPQRITTGFEHPCEAQAGQGVTGVPFEAHPERFQRSVPLDLESSLGDLPSVEIGLGRHREL